ncbi:hypothetical protein D9M73_258400 [compost metagenome]
MELEEGLTLGFWAETEKFEALYITLKKTTPSTAEFKGVLPKPYSFEMTQSSVRALFGEPYEFRGPIKMPQPLGQTGGWDSYKFTYFKQDNVEVVFKYTAAMEVSCLVFALIDKGHD